MGGAKRIILAEMYDGKIAKGRKPLASQIEKAFGQSKIASTKPENFKKKKAKN